MGRVFSLIKDVSSFWMNFWHMQMLSERYAILIVFSDGVGELKLS